MIVEELKKSILAQAFDGSFNLACENDQDVQILLDKIKEKKEIMIKDGVIPKDNKLKNINIEQLKAIPSNWKYVRVQDIALVITDYVANGSFKTLRENTKTYKTENYAIFVRTMDLTADFNTSLSYIDEKSYNFLKKSVLYGGELILPNIGGSIGKTFIMPKLDKPMSLAPNSIMLKFDDDITKKYFKYYIDSPYGKEKLLGNKGGTATPKFSKTDLRAMIIPLPPIQEQKRIIDKIETIFEKLEEVEPIERELELIKLSFPDEMKKAILEYAMSGKLINNNEWKDETIFKNLWEVTAWDKKFKEVENSHQKIVCKYKYYLASEMQNLKKDNGDVYLLSTGNFEGWTTEDAVGDYLAEGEVVAIPWGGSPSVKYYKGKFVTSDNRIATSIDTNILLNKYLYYFMQSKINYLDTIYRGTSLRHPSMKAILDMKIPVPSIEEQKMIVDKIEEILPLIEDIEKIYE